MLRQSRLPRAKSSAANATGMAQIAWRMPRRRRPNGSAAPRADRRRDALARACRGSDPQSGAPARVEDVALEEEERDTRTPHGGEQVVEPGGIELEAEGIALGTAVGRGRSAGYGNLEPLRSARRRSAR